MKTKSSLTLVFCFLVTAISFSQTINTIAGAYYGDGQTAFAIGIIPSSQVVDAAGNIYFTEPERHVVRKLSASGVYSIIAGTGIQGFSGDGGMATAAQLNFPYCIARDSAGNIYITDAPACRVRKVDLNGIITTIAGNGTYGFSGDGGPATQAQLNGVNGIALDKLGNIYITDFNNRRIRKISISGIITTIAGTDNGLLGSGNGGPATSAVFSYPLSVAVNSAGELFIADVGLDNIRKVGTNGIITAFAGPVSGGGFGSGGFGGDGGPATSALFNEITGIAIDAAGNVLIADNGNERIRKVNTSGIISTIAGTGITGSSGDGGPATAAQLSEPSKIGVDAYGNLFITTTNRIRKITTTGTISTVGGNGSPGYNGNNTPVATTQLYKPQGLAIDKQGNIYFADYENSLIRKITTGGIVITIAGTGMAGFSGDGGLATSAQINHPYNLTNDTAGNIYFIDYNNVRIRKIDVNGMITTIVGSGVSGFSGDGGPATAARISGPWGIAVDKAGNVFFSDRNNHRVRRVDTNGTISTIAGNGVANFGGDGGLGTVASLSYPDNVAIDKTGNVLIQADSRIRKVDALTGIITTIAGNGSYTYTGDGSIATATGLSLGPIATDTLGNIYLNESEYIRKINPSNIISTIAGGGSTYGDGGLASAAQIQYLSAINVDNQGNIYMIDGTNSRIRKITVASCGTWTGAINSNWENPQNWTCGQIPGSTSDVSIHAGTVKINSNVVVRSLHLDPGVNMVITTGYNFTVLQ